jgi:outer membrane protein assembly factor BamD
MKIQREIAAMIGVRHFCCLSRLILTFFIFIIIVGCSSDKAAVKKTPISDPTALFEKVKEKIAKRDFEEARSILQDIKAWDSSQEYSSLAQIRIADTYYEETKYDEAVAEYRKFLDLHTYHKYSPYVQYRIAMSYFKRVTGIDTGSSLAQQALDEFEKLRKLYPRNPYMEITEKRIKRCRNILAEYEFYVGKFYMDKGSHESAVQRFNNILKQYPDSKIESEAMYNLGLSYRDIGEEEKAVEVLSVLIEKYPTIKLSASAMELLASLKE